MVTVRLSYENRLNNGQVAKYATIYGPASYFHQKILKKGNEDYFLLSFFLQRINSGVELIVNRKSISSEKFEALDELVKMHNAKFSHS
jgi:hypothetical protein